VVNDRVLAGHLRNPSFTVPQGTVIPAVLETALDSTRPGGVRAIVERDVMGFDGTLVLIPRGSRLYGEYSSGIGAGQKRALIRWTRLTRPDAVIVNLDSPAADPLGRAGVGGKVNSHFLERFGGAILQSVLDIGVGVATRSVTGNGLILALPGSTQTINPVQPQEVQRTLKVSQGTSVSVFVARDLDFSNVDQ
jgi:type IV secretion system protein VirB10